jgi:hypothetical protein
MTAKITREPTKTLSVPKAGEIYYGIGRGASYAAAANGQIPTIRIGRLLRVPWRGCWSALAIGARHDGHQCCAAAGARHAWSCDERGRPRVRPWRSKVRVRVGCTLPSP